MKYTCEVIMDQPVEKVAELLDNPDNLKHWQPELVSIEPISGEPGQQGSQAKLTYKLGKGQMVLIETILLRNFPSAFHVSYEAKNAHNQQKNYFTAINDHQTKWVSENDFKVGGFIKIIGWLMPGMFKKQSQKYLDLFKAFAEKN